MMNSGPNFQAVDMDRMNFKCQLHCIEKRAYNSVLLAFVAQSDTISWGKEELITELRKELNITDTEHRELLSKIDSDDLVRMIRDWRKGITNVQEPHSGGMNIPMSVGKPPNKKMKASHLGVQSSQIYELQGEPCAFASKPQKYASIDEPYLVAQSFQRYASHEKPHLAAQSSQKYASHREPNLAAQSSQNYVSNREPHLAAHSSQKYASYGKLHLAAISQKYGSNGELYSAIIPTPCSLPEERRVDRFGMLVPSPTEKAGKSLRSVKASSVSKGRHPGKSHANDFCSPDDNNFVKNSGSIQICETRALLFEVERMVYGMGYPDPVLIEKAKLILEKHERSILNVLAELSNVSDEDNPPNEVRHHYSHKKLQGTW